jgi:hypothetical protein
LAIEGIGRLEDILLGNSFAGVREEVEAGISGFRGV